MKVVPAGRRDDVLAGVGERQQVQGAHGPRPPTLPRRRTYAPPVAVDDDDKGPEEPKRLALLADAARRLFLLSGNQCAFPDCVAPLVNEHGDFIGQIAHIEGVRGGRFNPTMTNEQRRAFENVLALCYPHHVETNDEERFPTEVMRRMKAEHEAKFAGVIARIMEAPLRDLTKETPRSHAQNLRRLSEVLGWSGLTEEELQVTAADVRSGGDALAALPASTRGALAVLVDRGDEALGEIEMPAFELEQVLGIGTSELNDHVAVLERHHFASYGEDWNGAVTVGTVTRRDSQKFYGSRFWVDLREFCRRTCEDVATVVRDLRFDVLDES